MKNFFKQRKELFEIHNSFLQKNYVALWDALNFFNERKRKIRMKKNHSLILRKKNIETAIHMGVELF